MIILVISDIHANLEALDAVLEDAGRYDQLWFLGDAVGYGPDPNACVERLLELKPAVWLAGNHDWAALGRIDISTFNPEARFAAEWTDRALTDAVRAKLSDVDPLEHIEELNITTVHGSPRHPIWEYILDAGLAQENFGHFKTQTCLFGHTHVPVIYENGVDGVLRHPYEADTESPLNGVRTLINPGSVGQPRDGNPDASYLILDTDSRTVSHRRVSYDIQAVQAKILDAGLPQRLAARLDYGW